MGNSKPDITYVASGFRFPANKSDSSRQPVTLEPDFQSGSDAPPERASSECPSWT
jgi:hypothetical protein